MAKVFILEERPFDYSPATVYGDLIVLDAGSLIPDSPNHSLNSAVINKLRDDLQYYVPGRDYIIPTGSPIRMVLVGMILKEAGDRHLFLEWNKLARHYSCYTINL